MREIDGREPIKPTADPRFELRIDEAGEILVITLRGNLRDDLLPDSRKRIEHAIVGKRRLKAVFDLKDLSSLTSLGIGFLFRLGTQVKDNGGEAVFVAPEEPSVSSVLEVSRFTRSVELVKDRVTAIMKMA